MQDRLRVYCAEVNVRTARLAGLLAIAGLFAVGAQADSTGGDGRPIIGGAGGHSPSCSSFQALTDSTGNITPSSDNGHCLVTGAPATSITFAILDANSNGGLSIGSPLIGDGDKDNWKVSCTSGVVDICTLTAPTPPEDAKLLSDGDDSDCDSDDFKFGIPVGCDITISTLSSVGGKPFEANSLFDTSTNNNPLVPFPEPSSFALFALGLSGLGIFRRKFAR